MADLKEKILFSSFKKILTKNPRNKKKLESINEKHFVEWKNEGRKLDKNSRLRRIEFMPRNLDQKCCSRIPSLYKMATDVIVP